MSYYIWRCPECGKQIDTSEWRDPMCGGDLLNGLHKAIKCERVEVVVPEEALTDEMVERAASTWMFDSKLQSAEALTKRCLLAAGPWTDAELIAELEARCRTLAEAAIEDEAEIERLSRKPDRENDK